MNFLKIQNFHVFTSSVLCLVIFGCGADLPKPNNLAEVAALVGCAFNKNYDCLTHLSTSSTSTSTVPSYKVKISASGMVGSVVVTLNSSEQLVATGGSYTFTTTIDSGSSYLVSVKTKPDSHTCALTNSSGKVSNQDVSVVLSCRPFKYIFETTPSIYKGALGGVVGADAICNSHANRPDTSSSYKALLGSVNVYFRWGCSTALGNCSDGIDNSSDWVLYSLTTYKRASDSLVIGTTTIDRVFNFNLTNPLGTAANHWTGVEGNSMGALQYGYSQVGTADCNGWTDGTVGAWGNKGNLPAINNFSGNSGNVVCTTPYPILCVEQ